MSEAAAEIVYLPLKAGIDLTTGEHQKTWEETLSTIKAQPGCRELFWGRQIEHPDVVEMVVSWEKLQDHYDFINLPLYRPFLERVKTLLEGNVHFLHVLFPDDQPFSDAGSAPVAECLTVYFELDHPKSAYDSNWAKLREGAFQTWDGLHGIVGGWGVEEQKHENLGKEGEEGPGKVFGAFIGWPSVEAHQKCRETNVFAKVIPYFRDGPKAVKMHHVAFQKY